MKKSLLLLAVVLLITANTHAQNRFHLGVKIAYNIPIWSWSFTPKDFTTSDKGATIGIFGDYTLRTSDALRVGLNYSIYEFSLSRSTGFRINHLELPIIYRINIIKDFGLKAYGGIGIGFSMDESAFWSLSDPALSNMPLLEHFEDEHFKNTRVFLPLGLAYDFPFGLSIDVGYALNINNMKGDIRNERFAQGVDSFHIGAAFIFGMRKNKTEL